MNNSVLFMLFFMSIYYSQGLSENSKRVLAYHSNPNPIINVIPKPLKIKISNGYFIVNSKTKIFVVSDDAEFKEIANYFAEKINTVTGYQLKIKGLPQATKQTNAIILIKDSGTALGEEGYSLLVEKDAVSLRAHKPNGLFYGIQTVRQLLPTEFERPQNIENVKWRIPCVYIEDKPRFPWRGLMIDCCRHFMPKEIIKRYIDYLAYLKMNRFHWHLTEDQGWRIEIKKYPKLTKIGAWRTEEDGVRYGGFYTQNEIKEIVNYAKSRYVTVIPEIEMPGHSVAALASYPEFSCTGGPFKVETNWGVHEDVYCAGNDKTFEFLQDVLSEVIELFPAKYIHIGGDECPKDRWQVCTKCQARIKKENLKDEYELQSYFIKRIENFLLTKNRQIIGWDEILEGGLAPNATVQSWRGMDGAIAATKSGHDAVLSPSNFTYIASDVGLLNLRKVYSFEPIPNDLSEQEAEHILGAECCVWTERTTHETIDSKVFPRIFAMAELLWTPKNKKEYNNFQVRLQQHYPRLDLLGVHYGYEARPISIVPTFNVLQNAIVVNLDKGQDKFQLYYTLNSDDPSDQSMLYKSPIIIKNTTHLKAIAYKDGKPYGAPAEKKFIQHLALGKQVKYINPYSSKYEGGGDLALVDGIIASLEYWDGLWQGFEEQDLDVIIDLGEFKSIKKINARFLQNIRSWIFAPLWVEYFVSNDNKEFQQVATIKNNVSLKKKGAFLREFVQLIEHVKGRFVRIHAKNISVCPDWHVGAGGKAWLFADEIIIE